ncbi:hypothetical protein IE53DRAFT_200791 [Violaceomyces palustris]|uniref:Uncharacterized protein n=1 Tax=Violaceomyces palustris TaxID=1673888 RepID=A0ACD0NR90_9BASI|nr:hypothetical protein IE53DRAFT_200791 [Violaceomyces palustris]
MHADVKKEQVQCNGQGKDRIKSQRKSLQDVRRVDLGMALAPGTQPPLGACPKWEQDGNQEKRGGSRWSGKTVMTMMTMTFKVMTMGVGKEGLGWKVRSNPFPDPNHQGGGTPQSVKEAVDDDVDEEETFASYPRKRRKRNDSKQRKKEESKKIRPDHLVALTFTPLPTLTQTISLATCQGEVTENEEVGRERKEIGTIAALLAVQPYAPLESLMTFHRMPFLA